MDVSRIEAISPKQIDWRKLTSKEIIEYDDKGVSVPPEYLQWAKTFINEVNAADKDETTYENAQSASQVSKTSQDEPEKPIDTDTETSTETTSDTTSTTDETTETEEQDNRTEAQKKRDALNDAGVSLRKQAKIFTADSKNASGEMRQSISLMEGIENASNNEIAELESFMQKILADAEKDQAELKTEVAKINDSKSDSNSFGKIDKLEQQLERYGNTAQGAALSAEIDMNGFDAQLNAQTEKILYGQDFGTETEKVGDDLLRSIDHNYLFRIRDYIIGKKAVKTGKSTVDLSLETANVQSQVLQTNSANLAQTVSFKSQIEELTGVGAIELEKPNDNPQNEETNDNNTSKPSDTTAQTTSQSNSQTDTQTESDKAASGNLDQIIQAKIRRGEIEPQQPQT